MKKVFAVLGSLMIVAGLKAQKDTVIKKETTPPVNTKRIDSSKSKSLPEKILLKLNELCEVQDPLLSKATVIQMSWRNYNVFLNF